MSEACGSGSVPEDQLVQDMEIRDRLGRIKNKILVMSGKGGVGKSSVAAFLAIMLAAKGEGEAVRKKNDVQRMAEANRAFAHLAR